MRDDYRLGVDCNLAREIPSRGRDRRVHCCHGFSAFALLFGWGLLAGCERASDAALPASSETESGAPIAVRAPDPARPRRPQCVRDETFPSPWRVPEASAAAEVELSAGVREILVIGDSGRHGAAMAWSQGHGTRPLTLPLDESASDDLEGMAWIVEASGAHLYTLTSSGAVRRFAPDGRGGLVRDIDAYAIGFPPLSCTNLRDGNCGKNWEGLCLRPSGTRARCAGYAASKTETSLYCVVFGSTGRPVIDASVGPIKLEVDRFIRSQGALSDCAFGAAGGPAEDVLLVTTNIFGGSTTYLVNERPTGPRLVPLDILSTPSNEAIAVDRNGALYAFMDDNGETSAAARFRCTGWSP